MPVGVRCLWEKYFLRKQSASGSLLVRPCVYQADASPCDSQRAVWVLLASACVTVCAVWSVPRSVGNPHRHSNALQRPSLYVRLFARRITSTHTHALLLSTKRCSPRSYRIGRKRFEKVSNKERSRELARCFRNLTNVPAVCTIFEMIPFFQIFELLFRFFLVQILFDLILGELNCRSAPLLFVLNSRIELHWTLLKRIEIITLRSAKFLCDHKSALKRFRSRSFRPALFTFAVDPFVGLSWVYSWVFSWVSS